MMLYPSKVVSYTPEHREAAPGGRHTWSVSHRMLSLRHGVTEHRALASSSPSGQSLTPSQTWERKYQLYNEESAERVEKIRCIKFVVAILQSELATS